MEFRCYTLAPFPICIEGVWARDVSPEFLEIWLAQRRDKIEDTLERHREERGTKRRHHSTPNEASIGGLVLSAGAFSAKFVKRWPTAWQFDEAIVAPAFPLCTDRPRNRRNPADLKPSPASSAGSASAPSR